MCAKADENKKDYLNAIENLPENPFLDNAFEIGRLMFFRNSREVNKQNRGPTVIIDQLSKQ